MTSSAGVNLFGFDTVAQAGLGDEYQEGPNRWKYIKVATDIAQYSVITLDKDFLGVAGTTTTSAARPTSVCLTPYAFTAGTDAVSQYGWVLIGPFSKRPDGTAFKVLTGAAAAVDVVLKTSNTAGKVDDGDDSGDVIEGLVLTESGAGGAGSFTCEAVKRMVTNG